MDGSDETLGETMNRELYLDPGFKEDHPGLVDALEDEIDETVERAQAALDKRRADEADATVADVPDSADQP
jgi:hypothetical protein